jgi:putative heme-binding domain-containing protein
MRLRLRINPLPLFVGLALVTLGSRLGAQNPQVQDHPGQYSAADIGSGSRLYGDQCASCHGAAGDAVGGVDLRRGRFRTASSDDDLRRLVRSGVAAMPAFNFSDAELTAIVAFIRAGFDLNARAVKVGDTARGRTVFEGKGGCMSCHRVNGTGSRVAPDLSDIGAAKPPALLHLSLLDPTAAMLPVNRPVRVVTRDGKTIKGRRLNEDTYTLQLINEQERLVSLMKSDLREYEIVKVSAMPSYKDKLTTDEIADVVAYLLSLRG